MKYIIPVFIACILHTGYAPAQDLHFYLGAAPLIDGVISPGEWSGTDSCQITIGGTFKATVRFKHDGSNMYFVYYNHLESAVRCPEVNLDINNSKSAAWEGDDWWFHSSGSDCDNNGAPGVYSDCMVVQPDWESVPNFVGGGPNEDTVELRIPFTKISFAYSGGIDTIGIALDVTNTSTTWNIFPAGALVNNPSTWTNGIFYNSPMGVVVNEKEDKKMSVYPNPVSNELIIEAGFALTGTIQIFDMSGKNIMQQGGVNNFRVSMDVSQLAPGMYTVYAGNTRIKFVKQ